MKHIIKYR